MKDMLFLMASVVVIPVGTAVGTAIPFVRDLIFMGMIFGTTLISGYLDINFLSREWYRGTTRGIEVTVIDLLAIMLLLSCLLGNRTGKKVAYWPASLGWLLAFGLYAAFNVAISTPKIFGMFELTKIFRGMLFLIAVAYYVRGPRELRFFVVALCMAIGFESFMGLYQRYFLGVYRIPGTLFHPNNFSLFGCISAPLLFAVFFSRAHFVLRWACALCAVLAVGMVILSVSRMGFAAVGLTMGLTMLFCIGLEFTPKNVVILLFAAAIAGGMLYKSWDVLAARLFSASWQDEYEQENTGRGQYFRLANYIIQDYPLGVGLNNWSYYVSLKYGQRIELDYKPYNGTDEIPDMTPVHGMDQSQAPPAHSLLIITLGELGYPGVILLLAVWGRWFSLLVGTLLRRSPSLDARFTLGALFGLLAIFMQSQTEWAFRCTPVYMMVHMMMGAVVALRHHRTDDLHGLALLLHALNTRMNEEEERA